MAIFLKKINLQIQHNSHLNHNTIFHRHFKYKLQFYMETQKKKRKNHNRIAKTVMNIKRSEGGISWCRHKKSWDDY